MANYNMGKNNPNYGGKSFTKKTIKKLSECNSGKNHNLWIEGIKKNKMIDLYLKENKTITEIANIFNVSWGTIQRRLEKFNIKQRTQSEIMTGRYRGPMSEVQKRKISETRTERGVAKKYNNPMYGRTSAMKGKKHTEESRAKMSKTKTGMKRPDMEGRNNHNYGKPQKYYKVIYKNIGMRSRWEVKYAEYLDENKIKWDYEPTTFELKGTTYTPDFYLKNEDKYVEIKGRWIRDAKKKIKKTIKKYNIDLEILQYKDLKRMGIL